MSIVLAPVPHPRASMSDWFNEADNNDLIVISQETKEQYEK